MTKFLDNSNWVYRFVPFNIFSLKTIINNELWLGEPSKLSDPYEGEFEIIGFDKELKEDVKLKLFERIYPNSPPHLFEDILSSVNGEKEFLREYSEYIKGEIKKYFGVCCFSNIKDEILMWTHYADSHQGMCMVFDNKKLIDSIKAEKPEIEGGEAIYMPKVPQKTIEIDKQLYDIGNLVDSLFVQFCNRISIKSGCNQPCNKLSKWLYILINAGSF